MSNASAIAHGRSTLRREVCEAIDNKDRCRNQHEFREASVNDSVYESRQSEGRGYGYQYDGCVVAIE